ncbi:MAG: MG2 domain-containing protein [Planctomycetota bacterium]|nr:MG2 domain-containing protein [Planctomycetota bacterium]
MLALGMWALAENAEEAFKRAEDAFEKKNYKDAAAAYEATLKADPNYKEKSQIRVRLVACWRMLGEWDNALASAKALAQEGAGTLWEARAENLLASVTWSMPHWGSKQGEKFSRGKHENGWQYVYTQREDMQEAVAHGEKSRALYLALLAGGKLAAEDAKLARSEAIANNFDLAGFLSGSNGSGYHGRWRGRRMMEEELADGGAADAEDPHKTLYEPAEQYAANLSGPRKVLFLLNEIAGWDDRDDKEPSALALYRKALFLKNYWSDKTPEAFDTAKLLAKVAAEYKATPIAEDAQYALGLVLRDRGRFVEAVKELDQVPALFPKSRWLNDAASARQEIVLPRLDLQPLGAQLPGGEIKLQVRTRNIGKIAFAAYPVALDEAVKAWGGGERNGYNDFVQSLWRGDALEPHRGAQLAQWNAGTSDKQDHQWVADAVQIPLNEVGAYLISAESQGVVARQLLVVTDLSIVRLNVPGSQIFFVADALSGKPVEGAKLVLHEGWWENNGYRHNKVEELSGELGLHEYKFARRNSGYVQAFASVGKRFAMTHNSWSNGDRNADARYYRVYPTTDRPVYRPGQTVNFKVSVRKFERGEYALPGALPVKVEIRDPRGNKVYDRGLKLGESGSLADKLLLPDETALGMYQVLVTSPDAAKRERIHFYGNLNFRVEEYKKPEFEVKVAPEATQAKIGEPVKARIEARYYFGAPVTEGKVSYRVFRTSYRHGYTPAGRYDWLYGRGYGCCEYPLDAWGGRWRWGRQPSGRELILEQTAELGKDGAVPVSFETADLAKRFPDEDHRFEIEAEVVDASRRTIAGSGAITVTRNQFYVFLNAAQGYYRPGDKVKLEVKALTPDNEPVAAKGKLIVSKVKYAGEKNDKLEETKLAERAFETDAEGFGLVEETLDEAAQYKFAFVAEDAWKTEVEGSAFVWVRGEDFDARHYRFRDLEIVTDKRSYTEGETAHLMINANREDSWVMLVHDLDGDVGSFTVLHLPQKTKLIDIPIEKRHGPNFYIQGVTLRDGQVFYENREICVPPAKQFLNLSVSSDKPEYQPGQKGTFTFQATDHEGKPAQAELAFTLFDSSILYFQGELAPEVKTFFYGQRRQRRIGVDSSHQVSFQGVVVNAGPMTKFEKLLGYPPDFWGRWADNVEESLKGLQRGGEAGGPGQGGGFGYRARSLEQADRNEAAADGRAGEKESAKAASDAKPAAPAALANSLREESRRKSADKLDAAGESQQNAQSLVEAEIRSNFADSAAWVPVLLTGPDGKATLDVTFPDSLTTWKGSAYGLTASSQVGSASASVVTTKNLLVRLQAPRFFVERDEVVLSANVHNYLKSAKRVKCEIQLPSDVLGCKDPLSVDVEVPAGGEKRLDWTVKVLKEGAPRVLVKALTDEESDAMALSFPALVHGTEKFVADNGAYRPDQAGAREVSFAIPEERNPDATELRVTLSPSLAGAMLDALPYLLDYPYGCCEQTMSRFMPAVVAQNTLKQIGVNLEDLETKRKQIDPRELQAKFGYLRSPVFDSSKLDSIVQAGMRRLYSFQNGDGGWGWWKSDRSNPNMSAYVLYGLRVAKEANVAGLDENRRKRGLQFLQAQLGEVLKEKENAWQNRYYGLEQEAYASYVLALDGLKDDKALNLLWTERDRLNVYGNALLALTLAELKDERKQVAWENVLQYVKEDPKAGAAWVESPAERRWYWYNNAIESNAWALKAAAKFDPKGELAPKLTKHLLGQRHGHRWHSTKDTAVSLYALADYMVASGETEPNYEVTIDFDGAVQKTVKVNKENFFTFDNQFVIRGADIPAGTRKVTLSKTGTGALYYSAQLKYFTKEADIKGAGNELEVVRTYYKLTPRQETKKVRNAKGEEIEVKELAWDRAPLELGAVVKSGEQVEVELVVKAPNDYEYVIIEDPKAAGCEPVDLQSGNKYGNGLCSNMELRDEKVAFFATWLPKGEHRIAYKLRAEIPGVFHALPAHAQAMYAPEIRAISDEMRLGIKD